MRLNVTFQARVAKPCLLLKMDHGAGVQFKKHCERIPCLPDRRDTVVGKTLHVHVPCVVETSNSSDRFTVAKI